MLTGCYKNRRWSISKKEYVEVNCCVCCGNEIPPDTLHVFMFDSERGVFYNCSCTKKVDSPLQPDALPPRPKAAGEPLVKGESQTNTEGLK